MKSGIKFWRIVPALVILAVVYSCESNKVPTTTENVIKGIVYDENGNPLPGINIVGIDTRIGTVTNLDGEYEIKLPGNVQQLSYMFTGYRSQVIEIDNRSRIDVTLESESENRPPQSKAPGLVLEYNIVTQDGRDFAYGQLQDMAGNIIKNGHVAGSGGQEAITDDNGKFKMIIPPQGGTLRFSVEGYEKIEISVSKLSFDNLKDKLKRKMQKEN